MECCSVLKYVLQILNIIVTKKRYGWNFNEHILILFLATAARPHFSSSEDDDDADSDVNVDGDDDVEVGGGGGGGGDAKGEGDAAGNEEGGDVSDVSSSAIGMESSDFDTDFEADEIIRLKNNPVGK